MILDYITEKPVLRGFDEIKRVYEAVEGKGFIAGSYAAWMCVNPPHYLPNDVDIFTTSDEGWREAIYNLVTSGYEMTASSDMTASLSRPTGLPVQLIAPDPTWKEYPQDIIMSFDMDICRAVLLSPESVLADIDAGENRGLILKINSPLRVLKRILKYHRRGVEFPDSELLKLFRAWESMTEDQRARVSSMVMPVPDDAQRDYDCDWDEYFFNE